MQPAKHSVSLLGVDKPYEKMIPGKRPPLLKGMYTAVDIYAPSYMAMVVPRKAVHQGRVYIANEDNTLSIRNVDIQFFQGDLAVIRSGIEEGEKVIITDLIPVIDGMPLQITQSKDFVEKMKQSAAGNASEMQP